MSNTNNTIDEKENDSDFDPPKLQRAIGYCKTLDKKTSEWINTLDYIIDANGIIHIDSAEIGESPFLATAFRSVQVVSSGRVLRHVNKHTSV